MGKLASAVFQVIGKRCGRIKALEPCLEDAAPLNRAQGQNYERGQPLRGSSTENVKEPA